MLELSEIMKIGANMNEERIRINKFLSEAGVCSRREADRQILAGNVKIDHVIAGMGDRVMMGQTVTFQGRVVKKESEVILLAVNKPKGIVCTAEKRERNNIIDFLKYPKRIYPIGRLDKNSKGLLLMTNQGDIVNKMMRKSNQHQKEYVVTVDKKVSKDFIKSMADGVYLRELEQTTEKCRIWQSGKNEFHIVLTQGLNRQIRRMCEVFHYQVIELERIRIMNIYLGELKPGTYRRITNEEWDVLESRIMHSKNGHPM